MQWILSCFARDDFRISNRASWTRLYTLNKNKTVYNKREADYVELHESSVAQRHDNHW